MVIGGFSRRCLLFRSLCSVLCLVFVGAKLGWGNDIRDIAWMLPAQIFGRL